MFNDLAVKDFRNAFVEENVKTGIAFQVRALREKEGISQPQLGERAAKPQSVISRIEDPNYGKFTIRTLLDIAAAFDVALLVKFVSYTRLVTEMKDLSPRSLAVPSYDEELDSIDEAARTATALIAAIPTKEVDATKRGCAYAAGQAFELPARTRHIFGASALGGQSHRGEQSVRIVQ